MSEGMRDYRGADGQLQSIDSRAQERIADHGGEDYFGYEPPDYRGPGEYVHLPTMPYASYYLGEAAMQYAPVPDRPGRPSLGGLLAAGDTDWSYGEHCHIEHMWEWVSGMDDEQVRVHSVGWARAARLLDNAGWVLRRRAETLAGAWRSPAGRVFLEQVGRTLFSVHEWHQVANDNAIALDAVARETGTARFALRGLYERYLAARDAAVAGDPADDDPGTASTGGQTADRTTTGTTMPDPVPRTVDEVRREFHSEAVAITRRVADAYVNSQYFLLDQGREFAGPREVSTGGGGGALVGGSGGPVGGGAPVPAGAPPWLSPGAGLPTGGAGPSGAADLSPTLGAPPPVAASLPVAGASLPVAAASLPPTGLPGAGVSPGLGGYLAGVAPPPAVPAPPGPPALGGVPAGPAPLPTAPPVGLPPVLGPPVTTGRPAAVGPAAALGRPAAVGPAAALGRLPAPATPGAGPLAAGTGPASVGSGPVLRPGIGPAPVIGSGSASTGQSGSGPSAGARGGQSPGVAVAAPRGLGPPAALPGGAPATAGPAAPAGRAATAGRAAPARLPGAVVPGAAPSGPVAAGPLRPGTPRPVASRPVDLSGRQQPAAGRAGDDESDRSSRSGSKPLGMLQPGSVRPLADQPAALSPEPPDPKPHN